MGESLDPETRIRYTIELERKWSAEVNSNTGVPYHEEHGLTPEEELLNDLQLLDYMTGGPPPEGDSVWDGISVVVTSREIVKPDPSTVHNDLVADIAALAGEDANEVDFNALMRNLQLAKEYAEDEQVEDALRDDLRTQITKAKEAIGL